MSHQRITSVAVMTAALVLGGGNAFAGTVGVLAFEGGGELISDSVLEKLTTMVATEVDITGHFEFTTQYFSGEFPAGCAASTSCLARFCTAMGHDRLIVGTVNDGAKANHVAMRLRIFDPSRSTFERTVTQELEAARDTINNDIPPMVTELLTGERPKSAAEIIAAQEQEDDIDLNLSLDEVGIEQDEADVFVFGEDKPEELAVTDMEYRITDAMLDTGPLEAERERLRVLAKVLRMEKEERRAAQRDRRAGPSRPQLQDPNTAATDSSGGGEGEMIVIEDDSGGGMILLDDAAQDEPVAAPPQPEPVAAPPQPEPVAAPPQPEPVAVPPQPEPVTAPPVPVQPIFAPATSGSPWGTAAPAAPAQEESEEESSDSAEPPADGDEAEESAGSNPWTR